MKQTNKKSGIRVSIQREREREISKKNDLARRKRQHEFELQREKLEKENKAKKLQAKKNKMKVDGSDTKKKKKGASGFQVGKRKVKTKLTALAKAKAAQAMELDKNPILRYPHMAGISLPWKGGSVLVLILCKDLFIYSVNLIYVGYIISKLNMKMILKFHFRYTLMVYPNSKLGIFDSPTFLGISYKGMKY
ncbi:uncharacterized protein LOC114295963 [Camellia sinensis]|uniref:uncharacterized protein LOC114295963 n=1 Tax=Camellia sinensis TaxID=4442 RepID=UPI001036CD42|nr:uncharacterized protein LOC114295963 [Camellia sinensis]